jgi:hydrogenase maturation factor
MTEADFRRFLRHLAEDASVWAGDLNRIDITPLRVAFRCGEEKEKIFQDQQHLCAQSSDDLQAVIADLLKKQTIAGDIRLLMDLQFLNINVVDLYRMLIDLANSIADLLGEDELRLVDSLRGYIRAIQEEYGTYILKMVGYALDRAEEADARLDREANAEERNK